MTQYSPSIITSDASMGCREVECWHSNIICILAHSLRLLAIDAVVWTLDLSKLLAVRYCNCTACEAIVSEILTTSVGIWFSPWVCLEYDAYSYSPWNNAL